MLAGAVVVAAAVAARRRRSRRWDLANRNVLVTGGSRGLGLEVARELLAAGARVAICARDAATLDRARSELARRGTVVAIPADVTRADDVDRLVRQVRDRLGPIDAVINNAGTIVVGPVDVMTLEDFESAMAANFWGPLRLTLAVLPEMRRRRTGRIVNIASIGGRVAMPHLLPYSASKFALVGLSEGLRAELARDGIQVTTICPGLMRTGSPRHALFKGRHRWEYAWFSVSDALPGLSMDSGEAARQIVGALEAGTSERTLSPLAKAAATVHALAPGLTADMLGWVNRLMPRANGVGSGVPAKGLESESSVSPSWLTRLGERAALLNNQVG